MSAGVTLDAGALIALERKRERVLKLLRAAHARRWPVRAPAVAIAEWWRGRTDVREAILAAVVVETIGETLARTAGEAVAAIRGATTIDAIVMACAALRGDLVLTSDFDDLQRLTAHFPGVRVLAV